MKKIAPLLVLIAGVLWGTMGVFVRSLTAFGFESMELVALRAIGAVVFLGIGLLLYNKKLLRIKLKDIWCFVGTGIASMTFFNFCYFTTINMTSLSVAAILLYTAPAFVIVLSAVFFKEKIYKEKIIALILAFTGCIFVTNVLANQPTLSIRGIIWGLGAGFGYALYSIFGRFAIDREYKSLTITFYTFVFSAISTLPLIPWRHTFQVLKTETHSYGYLIGLILFNSLIAYIVYTIGLSYMEAGNASIIASVEPVVASLVGFFLYKEKLSIQTIIGIILVLGATVIVNKSSKKAQKR